MPSILFPTTTYASPWIAAAVPTYGYTSFLGLAIADVYRAQQSYLYQEPIFDRPIRLAPKWRNFSRVFICKFGISPSQTKKGVWTVV